MFTAVEPIPRDPGGGPGIRAQPRKSERIVYPHRHWLSFGSTGVVSGGSSSAAVASGPSKPGAFRLGQHRGQRQFHGWIERRVRARQSPRPASFPTGGQVPLSAFSRVELTSVPITVNHQGQFPVVTFSFNLAPGASLGDAVNGVNRLKNQLGLPASIQAAFQGSAQAFQAALANEWVLISGGAVTVYIVLGVLYESYIHPVTICPPSLGGRGARCWLSTFGGSDFSVIALIGTSCCWIWGS